MLRIHLCCYSTVVHFYTRLFSILFSPQLRRLAPTPFSGGPAVKMALLPCWVSAVLALSYGFAEAKPLADVALRATATVIIQPVRMMIEVPVSVVTHCPRPTDLVICHGHTLRITEPGFLKTVMTVTQIEFSTMMRCVWDELVVASMSWAFAYGL